MQFHNIFPIPPYPSPTVSPGPSYCTGPHCTLTQCRVLCGTADGCVAVGTGGAGWAHTTRGQLQQGDADACGCGWCVNGGVPYCVGAGGTG